MEESKSPAKVGRKPVYSKSNSYSRGAPRLATRIDPEALEWIESRPEGVRPYLERIVLADKRSSPIESNSPNDVPGQLLFPESEPKDSDQRAS